MGYDKKNLIEFMHHIGCKGTGKNDCFRHENLDMIFMISDAISDAQAFEKLADDLIEAGYESCRADFRSFLDVRGKHE